MAGFAIAFVIVVGIALVVLDANEDAELVDAWLGIARFFTDPFRGIFDLERGKEDLQIAINWGIAAAVYVAAGSLLGRLIDRMGKVRT
jgi:hypothetical protein